MTAVECHCGNSVPLLAANESYCGDLCNGGDPICGLSSSPYVRIVSSRGGWQEANSQTTTIVPVLHWSVSPALEFKFTWVIDAIQSGKPWCAALQYPGLEKEEIRQDDCKLKKRALCIVDTGMVRECTL
mgnify:CR=1 FL=1